LVVSLKTASGGCEPWQIDDVLSQMPLTSEVTLDSGQVTGVFGDDTFSDCQMQIHVEAWAYPSPLSPTSLIPVGGIVSPALICERNVWVGY